MIERKTAIPKDTDLPWVVSEIQDLAEPVNSFFALAQIYNQGGEKNAISLINAIASLISPGQRRLPGYGTGDEDAADAIEIKKVKDELKKIG